MNFKRAFKMKSYLKASILIGVMASMIGCDKFTDIHQDFIDSGEIIYAPKLDSVAVYAGNNRVKVGLWYFNGHHLKSTLIRWNNNQDSMLVNLEEYAIQSGRDSIEVVIPNLIQNAYSFTLQNIDIHSSRSLTTSAFGSAYGEDFQSTLINRRIRNVANHGSEGFAIEWLASEETMVAVEIKYVEENTQLERIIRRPVESQSNLMVVPYQGRFTYRGLFLPETSAVDTFYTEWSDIIQLPQ